jgi:hypothetical protein
VDQRPQPPVAHHHPEIARLTRLLRKLGAFHAAMSGSGSAVYRSVRHVRAPRPPDAASPVPGGGRLSRERSIGDSLPIAPFAPKLVVVSCSRACEQLTPRPLGPRKNQERRASWFPRGSGFTPTCRQNRPSDTLSVCAA